MMCFAKIRLIYKISQNFNELKLKKHGSEFKLCHKKLFLSGQQVEAL